MPVHPVRALASRLAAAMLLTGCAAEPPVPAAIEPATGPAAGVLAAKELVAEAARARRQATGAMTFAQFEATVFKEPFPGGKYIVDGDTAIAERKQLEEFFERSIKAAPQDERNAPLELIVNSVRGLDTIWSHAQKRALTYCVSTAFGARHERVRSELERAAAAWEAAADIDFVHRPAEDGRCDPANPNVLFDVRPVEVGGQYLARAFFPNEPRRGRNLLIDRSALELPAGGALQLVGVLRHELGHVLGFRHEHARPDSGKCFEDAGWRPLTSYDPLSVMHYPQCNGLGDWRLTLTGLDRTGVACIYGPAAGVVVSPSACPGGRLPRTEPVAAGAPVTARFAGQTVARGQERPYGPFPVASGSQLTARLMAEGGQAGDPDLYVRFDQRPSRFAHDCRPYLAGAFERCALDVPERARQAYVMVRGHRAGRYRLEITHQPGPVAAMPAGQRLAAAR